MLSPSGYWNEIREKGIAALLFVVLIAMGYYFSAFPPKSIKGGWELFRSLFVFFAGGVLLSRSSEKQTMSAFFRASWVAVIILVGLYFWSISQWEWRWSLRNNGVLSELISGIHEYANVAAMCLLVAACAVMYDRQYRTPAVWALLVILVGILVVSDSRGAYAALLFCGLLALGWWKKPFFYMFWAASLGLIVAMVWVSFFHQGDIFLGYTIPPSFMERIILYQGTWSAFLDKPWLGYGLNSFKFAPDLIGGGLDQVMPHNIYLEILFSVGLVGTTVLVVACALLLKGSVNQGADAPRLLLYRSGVLLFAYLQFRGLTELHLNYKVYVALFLSIALIHAGGRSETTSSGKQATLN